MAEYDLDDWIDYAEWYEGKDGFPAESFKQPYIDIYSEVTNIRMSDVDGKEYRVGGHRAEEYLDPLFSAISWDNLSLKDRSSGTVDVALGERYMRWRHRRPDELGTDLAALSIRRGELQEGVAEYLKHPEIHSEFLDWYCADTLTYMQWHGTVDELRFVLSGFFGGWATEKGFALQFASLLWRGGWWIGKWAVWLAILYFVYDFLPSNLDALVLGGLLVATTILQVRHWRTRARLTKLINEMRAVYDLFATRTFSWDVVWQELNRTRELGAVWPGELYKLVDTRKQADSRN